MIGSTRCRVLAALSDMRWQRTRVVAEAAGIGTDLAIHHLRNLERDGYALSRGSPRKQEWCWWPGGYGNQCSDSEVASVPM